MTKKTLIELMLENDVKWPEGVEFAAQDKSDLDLTFYNVKPTHIGHCDVWEPTTLDGGMVSWVNLPELCRNWHQTIVTREQYEKAKEMRDGAERNSEDAKPSKCIGKLHIDVQVSGIISQIVHHQAESQRHEEAMLDHNNKELAFRDQLNEMLSKVGMKVVDVEREVVADNGGWPDYCDENGIVVDWDRVLMGSEVECVECGGGYNYRAGNIYKFGFDYFSNFGPLDHNWKTPSKPFRAGFKFRLIK